MATEIGEAILKLKFDGKDTKKEMDDVEKKADKVGSNMASKAKTVGKNIGKFIVAGFTAATAAAVAFSKKSIDAFNEQEAVLAKLNQMAKNQNWAEGAVDDLMKHNAELQKVGIIGDEVTAAGQAQLGTFALSAEAIKKLTPAMDDLIANNFKYGATTDNAAQMANLMGKVMTGNVGALSKYGVTLNETQKKLLQTGDEMTRAATLAEVLKQNYGGVNEALASTPQGKVKQLSNAFGDLKESFGSFLAGSGDLDSFFNNFDSVLSQALDLIEDLAPNVIEGVSKLLSKVNEKLPMIIEKVLPIITDVVIALANALIENAPVLIDSAVKITVAVVGAVIENLPKIMESLAKAIPGAIGPILAVLGGALVFGKIKKLVGGMFTGGGGIIQTVTTGMQGIGRAIASTAGSLMTAIKSVFVGIGQTISGFIKAFAGPEVLVGALGFAAVAAAIAAAILLIGGAIGIVMPVLEGLMNSIIIPLATFIATTVINLITVLTVAIINITQQALIPLGEFIRDTFLAIVQSITDALSVLTNSVIIPLINVLSGAFINVMNTVANVITSILGTALKGITEIIRAVGDGFLKMGQAIQTALQGVQGVLATFADMIKSIAAAAVAMVSLVVGRSVNYGSGYAHLFAEGGKVEGPGTSTSDSIPAMLSDGEYVINAAAAKRIGYGTLDAINGQNYVGVGGITSDFDGNNFSNYGGREIIVNMTNKIDSRLDAEEIGRVMMQSIRRAA